jgi:hypothetical protein
MERETGIEPVTSSLGSWRSTAELLPLNFVRLPFHPDQDNARWWVSFLFPRDVVPMVHDGATEVTYNEPEYCEQHILDSWRHWDIMPQAGCERETADIQTGPLLKAVSGAKTAPLA